MEQKHRIFDIKKLKKLKRFLNVKNIFIFLFVVVNITDIITTVLAKSKHTMDYELNPLFAITNSAFAMYTFKIFGVLFLLWYMIRRYPIDVSPFYRYFMMYVIVLFFVILVGASVNNYLFYKTSVEDLGDPIPREQKVEVMLNDVGDLKYITDIGTKTKRIVIPPLFSVFVLNMLQFIVWRSFEKHSIENIVVNMRLIR